MKNFGQQVIVTFNRFASDTDEEIALVAEHCKEKGVGFAVNTVFADGGKAQWNWPGWLPKPSRKTRRNP